MNSIVNCINNTLKRKEDQKKLKKKYEKDIKKYFSQLKPSDNEVNYKEYSLIINIYANMFSKEVAFVCCTPRTNAGLNELPFELVEQIYNDREIIMRELGKNYGCI